MTADTFHDHDHNHYHSHASSPASLVSRLSVLLPLLGEHWKLIAIAYLTGTLHQVLALASAGVGAFVIAKAAFGTPIAELSGWIVLLIALILPYGLTRVADSTLTHLAAFRALAEIRGKIYLAFERLAPGYLLERRSGDLGAAAISDVEQVELFFAHTLSQLAVAATVPIATTILLASFHWSLAVALLPVLLVLALVPAWLRRHADLQGRELRETLGQMSSDSTDTLQGLRELLNFGATGQRLALLRRLGDRLGLAKAAHGRRSGVEYAATDTIGLVGMLIVLVLGANLVLAGDLDAIFFPVAVVLAAGAMAPVLLVTEVAHELSVVASAADRITMLVNEPAPVVDLVETSPSNVTPHVRFDHVGFAYRRDLQPALSDVSFDIRPGETVALVGYSGAGKSTSANLLLRFWDVMSGAISIGGHDVRKFRQEDLRSLMTLVPQETFLFNISLRENIRLGRADATDAEVSAAAAAAQVHDFITSLPDGYDALAGELGSLMSGGQRQRIAIARALLKDSPILVMDEAVSNLDAASEKDVNRAMEQLRRGRTTLIIAHRLSTIRTADRIIVMSGGKVVETGTHAELKAAGGAYVTLLATQLATDTINGTEEV